jgi:hypothetical protein
MKAEKNPAAIFAFKSPWRRGWLGGIVKSAAKSEAARRNGCKGGRPRKNQAPGVAAIAFRNPSTTSRSQADPARETKAN